MRRGFQVSMPGTQHILVPGQNPQGRSTEDQESHLLVTELTPRFKQPRI
jgi:hypothetical protein